MFGHATISSPFGSRSIVFIPGTEQYESRRSPACFPFSQSTTTEPAGGGIPRQGQLFFNSYCKANRFYNQSILRGRASQSYIPRIGRNAETQAGGTQQKGMRGYTKSHTLKAGRIVKACSQSTHHMETGSRTFEARQRVERNDIGP